MSLKQKCEAAPLALIEAAGTYTGKRIRSQEAQVTTFTAPYVVAVAELQGPAVLERDGSSLGLERVRLVIGIKGSADKNDTLPDPVASHSANVEKIRDVLQIDDLAAQLSAAQAEFTVVAAMPAHPPPPDPEERNFVDFFAWDLIACESDI